MRAKAAAASAGAATILGLPMVAAGVGSGADEAPPAAPPEPKRAEPNQVARLQDQLAEAQRTAHRNRVKARRLYRRLRAVIRHSYDPVRAGLLCIHGAEGSWRDSGDPYWGGLQMDRAFMTSYGRPLVQRFGYAHRWPIGAQLAVGEVAFYSGRGYGPWPNTRRVCGL